MIPSSTPTEFWPQSRLQKISRLCLPPTQTTGRNLTSTHSFLTSFNKQKNSKMSCLFLSKILSSALKQAIQWGTATVSTSPQCCSSCHMTCTAGSPANFKASWMKPLTRSTAVKGINRSSSQCHHLNSISQHLNTSLPSASHHRTYNSRPCSIFQAFLPDPRELHQCPVAATSKPLARTTSCPTSVWDSQNADWVSKQPVQQQPMQQIQLGASQIPHPSQSAPSESPRPETSIPARTDLPSIRSVSMSNMGNISSFLQQLNEVNNGETGQAKDNVQTEDGQN